MSERLPVVQLANFRGDDPRARRRFVTALGDALRDAGGVALDGVGGDPDRALADALAALASYFGVAEGDFADRGGAISERGRIATLLVPAADDRVRVGVRGGALGTAVVVPGPALETLTAGVVRASLAECERVVETVSATSDSARPLAAFEPG